MARFHAISTNLGRLLPRSPLQDRKRIVLPSTIFSARQHSMASCVFSLFLANSSARMRRIDEPPMGVRPIESSLATELLLHPEGPRWHNPPNWTRAPVSSEAQ